MINNWKALSLVLVLSGILSCSKHSSFPEMSLIKECLIPVTMGMDSTTIHLSDFIPNTTLIDSINVHPSLNPEFDKKNGLLHLHYAPQSAPVQSLLSLWVQGFSYDILLRKSQKIASIIRYAPLKTSVRKVQIAGDINSWNPSENDFKLEDGVWKSILYLNPGRYQYKLVVDGKWINDPANMDSASNGIGGYNSVLEVKSSTTNPPELFTSEFSESKIKIGFKDGPTRFFVFWQNHLLGKSKVKVTDNELVISVPKEAKIQKNSYIRVFASNDKVESNDILIPLVHGKIPKNMAEAGLNRPETQIMYFLLVDRFLNGDRSNDQPVLDKSIDFKSNYQGGDIAGIIEKIKSAYFQDLGFNTVWVSPIFQNPELGYVEYPAPHRKFSGYHGYWPISLKKIDHRFGNDAIFKNLIATAHENNLRVVMDYVANHIHQEHPIASMHPEWLTPLVLKDGRKNIRIWDEQRLTTWFDTFLPDLDYSNPDVIQAMTDTALYWVKNFGIDGFRHDATKHIHEEFWRMLSLKIKAESAKTGKHLYQVGETFGSRELISQYINSGEMDGQFDFNLYFDARGVFLDDKQGFDKLNSSLKASFAYYGDHHLMANITGNHDLARFISYAGKGLSLNEDEKEAGWSRSIEVIDTVGYYKLMQLEAFVFTIPGIPVMYYGDEIGMPGAGDPDNRRMMKFEQLNYFEKKVKETVKTLAHLRQDNPELVYGEYQPLLVTPDTYVYIRTLFGKASVVIFNKSAKEKDVTFQLPERYMSKFPILHFGSKGAKIKNIFEVHLKPYSFEILSLR